MQAISLGGGVFAEPESSYRCLRLGRLNDCRALRSYETADRLYRPLCRDVFGVWGCFALLADVFQSRGLSPQQLGTLLALGTLARLVVGPIIGRIADRIQNLRAVLATCTALAVVAAVGLLPEQGYFLLLAIALCQAAALAPITTISDALAITSATDTRRKTFEYGLVRGTGSAAFVVGTLFAGQLLSQNVGLSAIVWMHAALLSGAIIGAALVPAF